MIIISLVFTSISLIIASVFFVSGGVYAKGVVEAIQGNWYYIALLVLMNLTFSWSFYRGSSGRPTLTKIALMILLGIGTFLIISFVQSSLTLSLGMLGALSIIRFRTPIKEPLDLVFIFSSIILGIGFGAKQFGLTVFGYFVILLLSEAFQLFGGWRATVSSRSGFYVLSCKGKIPSFEKYNEIFSKKYGMKLLRFEENEFESRAAYFVVGGHEVDLLKVKEDVEKVQNPDVYFNYTSSDGYEELA